MQGKKEGNLENICLKGYQISHMNNFLKAHYWLFKIQSDLLETELIRSIQIYIKLFNFKYPKAEYIFTSSERSNN